MNLPRPRRLPTTRKLAYAIASTLLALTALELGARALGAATPRAAIDVGAGFTETSRLFVADPTAAGWLVTNPAKAPLAQPQRFAAHKVPGTLRVAVVGGSSVLRLEAQLRRLAGQLGTTRPAEVLNAGIGGYGSQRLVYVVDELLGDDLDALVLYLGHNEFEELDQLGLVGLEWLPAHELLLRSELVRLLRDGLAGPKRERLLRAAPDHAPAWRHRYSQREIDGRMDAFRTRYDAMVRAAAERGVPTIVSTVAGNLVHPELQGDGPRDALTASDLYRLGRWEEGARLTRRSLVASGSRHQVSDLENGIVREVAARHDVRFVDFEAEVARAEPHGVPGETLFADHCHLNDTGNELWLAVFAPVISEALDPGAPGSRRR